MLARNPRLSLNLVGALTLLITTASPTAAAPGDLDPTFDDDGKVTTHFIFNDQANGMAIQADGKIVAAGFTVCEPCAGPVTPHDFALSRYNADGSLDPAFDGDGRVRTDFAGGSDQAFAVAIQGDGKIVAAGSASVSGVDFALVRYNSDGSLDPTFDGDGRVTTDYGFGSSQVHGLAIQADGKIVAAGYGSSTQFDFFLARYLPNGSLDPTFDEDGKVTFTPFPPSNNNRANAVAVQGDGKIVAAGCARCSSTGADFALARYLANGSLDGSFAGGRVTTDFAGAADEAFSIAIQGDGKIAAAGIASGTDFALARYNTDGSPDPTFDGDGKVTTDFGGSSDHAFGIALQGNGKLVAAGCTSCSTNAQDFALARYKTDGSLDPTFSGDGRVTTDFAGDRDVARAVRIQRDKKIVAAGSAVISAEDFALARYTVCRRSSRPMSIPICP
jgi:uncharacterized delta-60 repeat protein